MSDKAEKINSAEMVFIPMNFFRWTVESVDGEKMYRYALKIKEMNRTSTLSQFKFTNCSTNIVCNLK